MLQLRIYAMRRLAFFLIALVSIADLAESHAAEPPLRPALIGNGAKALINLIDTKKLMEKGQVNAALSFQCFVNSAGGPVNAVTYRGTAESKALDSEVS